MFQDEYEFDYDRVVEDSESLYEDDYFDDGNSYDYSDQDYYEHYYHNVVDELDNE
jgi:hypothetical protein